MRLNHRLRLVERHIHSLVENRRAVVWCAECQHGPVTLIPMGVDSKQKTATLTFHSFGTRGFPLQTMAGLGRASLPQLGPGRGRVGLGPPPPSPVQSSPVAAAERPTARVVTPTGRLRKMTFIIYLFATHWSVKDVKGRCFQPQLSSRWNFLLPNRRTPL